MRAWTEETVRSAWSESSQFGELPMQAPSAPNVANLPRHGPATSSSLSEGSDPIAPSPSSPERWAAMGDGRCVVRAVGGDG
eukprot:5988600-Prymnesium_polylepis.1